MDKLAPYSIKTITEFHRLRRLPGPMNPLISVLNFEDMRALDANHPRSWVLDFYAIAVKKNFHAKLKYGQQLYDFDHGVMTFMAPGQKIGIEVAPGERIEHEGWLILFHPDFLWDTSLTKKIKQYEFFGYAVNEALFLSDREEAIVNAIIEQIRQEYSNHIDHYTQEIIVGQLEVLLNYSQRFYQRQFVTRKIAHHDLLTRLEQVLSEYFDNDEMISDKGFVTVASVAEALHVSPNYLSGLLKNLTGKSTQEHIHEKLIEKAKEKLSTTNFSVSEIAYMLGFNYPQSFSKLFKSKTELSPNSFRRSFN